MTSPSSCTATRPRRAPDGKTPTVPAIEVATIAIQEDGSCDGGAQRSGRVDLVGDTGNRGLRRLPLLIGELAPGKGIDIVVPTEPPTFICSLVSGKCETPLSGVSDAH